MKLSWVFLVSIPSQVSSWSQDWKDSYSDFDLSFKRYRHPPSQGQEALALASNITGKGQFKQLIDHNDPSKGTFDQLFMWSSEWWGGPGSPIVMFTPGEAAASPYTTYLTLNRTSGVLARELGAAIFIIEHRYWGNSTPYSDLTTANLTYLTLENSILDLTYFAQNIKAPWAPDTDITAEHAPWVMSGGSYSGALAAWTESVQPGVYWAYHASSAPVQAISDYAAYFYPVQQGMPKNCSADIDRVVNYMDGVFTSGTDDQIHQLKALFKLEDLAHNDDVMGALENGPWLWQGNQLYTGYSPFYHFCDYIENVNSSDPRTYSTSDGVGLEKALHGYAKWFTTVLLPDYCYDTYGYSDFNTTNNILCFDTYNASSPMYSDTSLANTVNRQWSWMLCNEPFGYWQDGAPLSQSTLVSRLLNAKYWIRQCDLWFPPGPNGETYGIAKGKIEADTNNYTKGWDSRRTSRLIYVNGQYDPWRESGVSADIRPGGPLQSTAQTPVQIVSGGFHTSDLITRNGEANAACQDVINRVVQQLVVWVGQWTKPTTRGVNQIAVSWEA